MISAVWPSYVIDWLSVPAVAAVLILMWLRSTHREYPLFFSYLLVTEAAGLIRYAAQFSSQNVYFYTYWISDLTITFFNLIAVYELFVRRIFPRFYKVGLYRYLFPMLGVIAVAFAWLASIEPPNVAVLAIEDRALDALVVAILMGFGVLMLVMGRQWKKHDFGIAFGFAVSAAGFLFASTVWTRTEYKHLIIDIPVIAYDISSLIWLFSFWSADRSAKHEQAAISPELVSEARAWQSLLRNWISSKKS